MDKVDPTAVGKIEEEGLGAFLARARAEKDVSLRSISERTRIRTYYLENIERGNFDRLPMGPVGLGFVRAFAQALDADADAVGEAFKRARRAEGTPDPEEDDTGSFARPRLSSPSRGSRLVPVAVVLLMAVFLLAGGGVLWLVKGKTEWLLPVGSIVEGIKSTVGTKAEQASRPMGLFAPAGQSAQQPPAPVAKPVATQPSAPPEAAGAQREPLPSGEAQPAPSSVGGQTLGNVPVNEGAAPAQESLSASAAQTASSPAPPPAPETPPAAPPGEPPPLTLRVFASQDTWLRIVVDAESKQEFLLEAGSERDWSAAEKFTLTVGNIEGTQISLNGASIALPQNPSNVLRDFVITRKSLN